MCPSHTFAIQATESLRTNVDLVEEGLLFSSELRKAEGRRGEPTTQEERCGRSATVGDGSKPRPGGKSSSEFVIEAFAFDIVASLDRFPWPTPSPSPFSSSFFHAPSHSLSSLNRPSSSPPRSLHSSP